MIFFQLYLNFNFPNLEYPITYLIAYLFTFKLLKCSFYRVLPLVKLSNCYLIRPLKFIELNEVIKFGTISIKKIINLRVRLSVDCRGPFIFSQITTRPVLARLNFYKKFIFFLPYN